MENNNIYTYIHVYIYVNKQICVYVYMLSYNQSIKTGGHMRRRQQTHKPQHEQTQKKRWELTNGNM